MCVWKKSCFRTRSAGFKLKKKIYLASLQNWWMKTSLQAGHVNVERLRLWMKLENFCSLAFDVDAASPNVLFPVSPYSYLSRQSKVIQLTSFLSLRNVPQIHKRKKHSRWNLFANNAIVDSSLSTFRFLASDMDRVNNLLSACEWWRDINGENTFFSAYFMLCCRFSER